MEYYNTRKNKHCESVLDSDYFAKDIPNPRFVLVAERKTIDHRQI